MQLEGYQTDGSQVTRDEMEQAVGVIRQRVDSLGVTEPEIQIQGQNQVIVNIPGITDADRAVEVIGRTAQLGFYEVLATDGQVSVPQDEVDQVKRRSARVCERTTLSRRGRPRSSSKRVLRLQAMEASWPATS